MNNKPSLLFILSLPRSGSTLLQRIMGAHPKVATISEPWVLLPVLSVFDRDIGGGRYNHDLLVRAIADVCERLPAGREDYYEAVRAYAETLYQRLAGSDCSFFLDKTPRYHLIAQPLLECFPDAKIVILWRNPVATIGSRLHSYGGVWRGHNYQVDLYKGLPNLIELFQQHSERICAVRFEDLVRHPNSTMERIGDYTGIHIDGDIITRFAETPLSGSLGDRSGVANYTEISTAPLEKWKESLSSPLRRAWCENYLSWLGQDRLAVMGYDLDTLMAEMRAVPMSIKSVPSDALRMAYGWFRLNVLPLMDRS